MRVLSDHEVSKSQVAQDELVFTNKLVQLSQLRAILFNDCGLSGFPILVEEEALGCACNFSEDREEAFQSCVILSILSKKLSGSPTFDDVSLDSSRLSDVVFAVDQIWQVGEVKTKMQFVLLEPVIGIMVMVVFKMNSCVRKQQSWHLSQASDSPVGQSNTVELGLHSEEGRKERLNNCVRTLIVSLNAGQFLEVVSNAPPEKIVPVFGQEDCLEVVEVFCQVEISKSQVSESELTISNKLFNVVDFGLDFRKHLVPCMLPLWVSEKFTHLVEGIAEYAQQIFNLSLILQSLAEQVGTSGSLDDVLGDGR